MLAYRSEEEEHTKEILRGLWSPSSEKGVAQETASPLGLKKERVRGSWHETGRRNSVGNASEYSYRNRKLERSVLCNEEFAVGREVTRPYPHEVNDKTKNDKSRQD